MMTAESWMHESHYHRVVDSSDPVHLDVVEPDEKRLVGVSTGMRRGETAGLLSSGTGICQLSDERDGRRWHLLTSRAKRADQRCHTPLIGWGTKGGDEPMSKSNHPKKVSEAGKTLADPKSSKAAKSKAGETLAQHKEKRH